MPGTTGSGSAILPSLRSKNKHTATRIIAALPRSHGRVCARSRRSSRKRAHRLLDAYLYALCVRTHAARSPCAVLHAGSSHTAYIRYARCSSTRCTATLLPPRLQRALIAPLTRHAPLRSFGSLPLRSALFAFFARCCTLPGSCTTVTDAHLHCLGTRTCCTRIWTWEAVSLGKRKERRACPERRENMKESYRNTSPLYVSPEKCEHCLR